MSDFTADFEAGVNGATITTGGGEASATAWDAVNGTPSYDNTHAAHGTLAGKFGTNGDYLRWTTGANPTDHYGRIYLYATANPAGDDAVLNLSGSGAGGVATIKVKTDGKLRVETYQGGTGADSTGSIALNQWIRLEYHVVHNGTTGTIECKYFSDASSTSATETIITPAGNTGASCDSIQFQRIIYGSDIWIDDLIANATNWVGPIVEPSTAPQVLSMQSHVFGHNMW